jgi:hypothetical protein
MPFQTGIAVALRDWGLTVREARDWRTRGSSDFQPRGHVCHHDVIGDQAGTHDQVPGIIIHGRPDLPGPLANFWLERDGDVHLVAAGRANHAGEGGWRNLTGNSSVWGTEANNLGTPTDPWPDTQLDAWYRLCAATCEFSGFDPSMVCGHKEWAPDRKVDPHSLDMARFRADVARAEKGDGLTVADISAITDAIVAQGKATRVTIVNQHKADREQQRKLWLAEAGRDETQTAAIEALEQADAATGADD